jgi:hypothetical protein
MKRLRILVALGFACYAPSFVSAAPKDVSKDPATQAQEALSKVPLPEWPATGAELILSNKMPDREALALAILNYTGSTHPGSIVPVLSSIIAAYPKGAVTLAGAAVKLAPAEAGSISQAAVKAAPEFEEQIKRALGSTDVVIIEHGNRPPVPPGLAGTSKPGLIRGNRPTDPPGLVYDPKPGRDPQRRRYGSP